MKYIYYESKKDTANVIFAEKQQMYCCREHFHRAFEIAYIRSGQADYGVEGEVFTAEADHIVFAHCYYRHCAKDSSPNVKYVVAVPENLTKDIAQLFRNSTLPSHMTDKEFNKTMLPYFENLVSRGTEMSRMLSKGYANVIFGTLAEHYSSVPVKPKSKNVSVIADILDYIDSSFREPITLEGISARFGYNKAYFSRLFNKHIGMSLNNYVNMVRCDAFDKLYKESYGANVAELAFSCGFASLATFYRARKCRSSQCPPSGGFIN